MHPSKHVYRELTALNFTLKEKKKKPYTFLEVLNADLL